MQILHKSVHICAIRTTAKGDGNGGDRGSKKKQSAEYTTSDSFSIPHSRIIGFPYGSIIYHGLDNTRCQTKSRGFSKGPYSTHLIKL